MMSTFTYTITKFDEQNKVVVVTFDDGNWAEIRLTNPLPKDKESLEKIIKQFTAPVEAIQAQTAPDADLSYINSLVGLTAEVPRMSLADTVNAIDMTEEEKLAQQEQMQQSLLAEQELFEAKVRAVVEKIQQESTQVV